MYRSALYSPVIIGFFLWSNLSAQSERPGANSKKLVSILNIKSIIPNTQVQHEAQTNSGQLERFVAKCLTKLAIDSLVDVAQSSFTLKLYITKKGEFTDVLVATNADNPLAQQMAQLIKDYPGAWQPAMNRGRSVDSYKILSMTICLKEDKERHTDTSTVAERGSTFDYANMVRYFQKKWSKIPDSLYRNSARERIMIKFNIDTLGQISGVEIEEGRDHVMAKRIMAIIQDYPHRCMPATRNGRPVIEVKRMPVTIIGDPDE
jgi:hypothetical protein